MELRCIMMDQTLNSTKIAVAIDFYPSYTASTHSCTIYIMHTDDTSSLQQLNLLNLIMSHS